MTLFKSVGGVRTAMTAQEEAEFLARTEPVPESVTKLQLRTACLATPFAGSNWWALAKVALAAADESVREEWELASVIERTNTTFVGFATGIGAQASDIDNVFILAARS